MPAIARTVIGDTRLQDERYLVICDRSEKLERPTVKPLSAECPFRPESGGIMARGAKGDHPLYRGKVETRDSPLGRKLNQELFSLHKDHEDSHNEQGLLLTTIPLDNIANDENYKELAHFSYINYPSSARVLPLHQLRSPRRPKFQLES